MVKHLPTMWETYWISGRFPGEGIGYPVQYSWASLVTPTCNTENLDSMPGLGRSPGEGNGNPLQYSCLENPMDGGAWYTTVHGVTKSWTWLSDFTYFTIQNLSILPRKVQSGMISAVLSLSVMSNFLQLHIQQPTRVFCPWVFSRQEYWRGCHALLQGIFPTQGLNPGFLHCRWESPEKPKNTGLGSLSFLQGIFLTQESNWGLPQCKRILYQLS